MNQIETNVDGYLRSCFKQIALAVSESYARGMYHGLSLLKKGVSWYDVVNRVKYIGDTYFERVVKTGKVYNQDIDLSHLFADMSAKLTELESYHDKMVDYLYSVADLMGEILESESEIAYRLAERNSYIENGIQYVKLTCNNKWCQAYQEHNNSIYQLTTEPELPLKYCDGDYRPYRPKPTEILNAETVKGFTKKESDIMEETEDAVNELLEETQKAIERILSVK